MVNGGAVQLFRCWLPKGSSPTLNSIRLVLPFPLLLAHALGGAAAPQECPREGLGWLQRPRVRRTHVLPRAEGFPCLLEASSRFCSVVPVGCVARKRSGARCASWSCALVDVP